MSSIVVRPTRRSIRCTGTKFFCTTTCSPANTFDSIPIPRPAITRARIRSCTFARFPKGERREKRRPFRSRTRSTIATRPPARARWIAVSRCRLHSPRDGSKADRQDSRRTSRSGAKESPALRKSSAITRRTRTFRSRSNRSFDSTSTKTRPRAPSIWRQFRQPRFRRRRRSSPRFRRRAIAAAGCSCRSTTVPDAPRKPRIRFGVRVRTG